MSERLQAPRGTSDVLPADWPARRVVEETARRILEAAGYRRIETPVFEATELFARGVGESTDIVQKEMYTFEDMGGRSVTLRPEGTAPVCRAYLEHGMQTLAQPVKLWYLSSFFRQEKPQAGRYRQFWQIGAEAIGSDDPAVDAELVLLLHTILAEVGVRGVRLRLGSLGSPEGRLVYRGLLQDHLRAHEAELSGEVRDPWGNVKRGVVATTKINRKDFGLTWNVALESGGVLVGDEIKIEIETQANPGA